MKIIDGIENIKGIPRAIVTSGTFDGIHFGHRKIIQQVVETSKKQNGQSVVLTFWPHPRFVLHPDDQQLKLLSSFEEKAAMLEEMGIDYLVKIKFTTAFSQLTSEEFIQQILIDKLNTHQLIIGYDHHFGKNREGSFEYLKSNCDRFGFTVQEIARQDLDEVAISSTKIRNALLSGDVHLAAQLMGRNYTITGIVVEGNRIGTDIGFPTANIEVVLDKKQIPMDGVYAVKVSVLGDSFFGMLNIGVRPTVDGVSRVIETNIFDLAQNIYGESITVEFVRRIRNEQKFASLEELKEQLIKDKKVALSLLK